MIEHAAVAGLNHVLAGQSWARERLRPFAGKRVQFRLAPLPDLRLLILDSGLVESAAAADSADLTVTAQPGAVPLLLARDDAAMKQVDLAGPADLANTVQTLFRELEWDAEEDLSKLFGDIAAHRMAGAARDFLGWQKEAASRLAENFAEYLTEEQPMLVQRAEAQAQAAEVQAVSEACARLERRIERLQALKSRS